MIVCEVQKQLSTVQLSKQEMLILTNTLNEVLHALDIHEFASRLGAQRDEVETLLRQVTALFDAMKQKK